MRGARIPHSLPSRLLLLALLLAGTLVVVVRGSSEPNVPDPALSTPEVASSEATLLIVAPAEVASLEKDVLGPAPQLEILPNVYEPLLRFAPVELATFQSVPGGDPDRFVNGLCVEWSVDPGGFSCRLGDQVSPFGNEVTSADVAWTFRALVDAGGVGLALMSIIGIDSNDPVTNEDEKRFTINTAGPSSSLLVPSLTLFVFSPFDATETQEHATDAEPFARDWLQTNTAGYGAYYVSQFTPGEVTLQANANYLPTDTSPAPAIQTVIYRTVADNQERAAQLETGAAQLARSTDFGLNDVLAGSDQVTLLRFPYSAQLALFLDTTVEPFTDAEVRRTLSCGIDVLSAVGLIYRGQSVVAHTVLTPGLFGEIADETADPCRDRDTNRAATAPDYAGLELDLHYSPAIIGPHASDYVNTIVSGLDPLGITVTPIEEPDPDAFQRSAIAGEYPILLTVIESHVPDAGFHLAAWFGPDSPLNLTRLETDEQRALLEEIRATPAGEPARTEQLRAYQQIVMQEAGVRPFVHLLNDYAIHNSLCGLRSDPGDLIYWQHLTRDCSP